MSPITDHLRTLVQKRISLSVFLFFSNHLLDSSGTRSSGGRTNQERGGFLAILLFASHRRIGLLLSSSLHFTCLLVFQVLAGHHHHISFLGVVGEGVDDLVAFLDCILPACRCLSMYSLEWANSAEGNQGLRIWGPPFVGIYELRMCLLGGGRLILLCTRSS